MKTVKYILLIFAAALLIAGCGKKEATSPTVDVKNPAASEPASTDKQPAANAPKPGKDGYITSKTGLKYKDVKVGKGKTANEGSTVTVDYRGWLDNGKVFDSSKKIGREPFSFTIGSGQVIAGWEEGIQGMKEGGVRDLIIPPSLGYGSDDNGTIPATSTLHFEVELHKSE